MSGNDCSNSAQRSTETRLTFPWSTEAGEVSARRGGVRNPDAETECRERCGEKEILESWPSSSARRVCTKLDDGDRKVRDTFGLDKPTKGDPRVFSSPRSALSVSIYDLVRSIRPFVSTPPTGSVSGRPESVDTGEPAPWLDSNCCGSSNRAGLGLTRSAASLHPWSEVLTPFFRGNTNSSSLGVEGRCFSPGLGAADGGLAASQFLLA